MNERKLMHYTKDSGETSHREVIIVSKPRKDYLVYDVSKLTANEIRKLQDAIEEVDIYRDDCMASFEELTGIKISSLWRSFKPEGIAWE